MIEFLNTGWGIATSTYLLLGIIVLKEAERLRGEDISLIPWVIGVVLWFPAVVVGFVLGFLGQR